MFILGHIQTDRPGLALLRPAAARAAGGASCLMFYVYLEGTSSRSTAYRKKRGLVYTADVSEKRSS